MGLLDINQENADSTIKGFRPWWERCSKAELSEGIQRLERALWYCKGRAADLRPGLEAHIERLKSGQRGLEYTSRERRGWRE